MSADSRSRGIPHEPTVFSQPTEDTNQVSRVFRAPPERVFHLFTDVATIPYVYASDPRSVTIEKFEFRPGGRYSIRVKMDDGTSIRFHGEYREIDPPRRVVNTFEVDSSPGAHAIETDDFEPVGAFTRVTVRWAYRRPEDRDKMWGIDVERAVTTMWDHVDELLEKGSPKVAGARA